MAAACPNDSTKEWKQLVSQTGETLAKMAFVSNGYVIPDVRPLTEIKKAIGFKSKTENFAGIATKLGRYNAKNGTSHKFDKVRIFGNTFQLTFKPNYLPISEETRRQKLARKNPILRVEGYDENVKYIQSNIDFELPTNQVNYTLKAATILSSDKGIQMFNKGKKAHWNLNKVLSELQIPKDQKQLILDKDITDREEIITSLLADNSFVIEVNTAKEKSKYTKTNTTEGTFTYNGSTYEDMMWEGQTKDGIKITQEEFDKASNAYHLLRDSGEKLPTQHYSNLTVPGGTNYTENAIQTPDIINVSTAHTEQFSKSVSNMLGWFRSDESASLDKKYPKSFKSGNQTWTNKNGIWYSKDEDGESKRDDLTDDDVLAIYDNQYGNRAYRADKIIDSKTRRILEVQSDLFQKGRDKENLIGASINNKKYVKDSNLIKELNSKLSDNPFDTEVILNGKKYDKVGLNGNWFIVGETEKRTYDYQNQFLQLLNKDNNWVNFFVKSIIQDSAKKGYEKVLFPTGNTASKVEGHTTLEEFKKQKEDRIKELEKEVNISDISEIPVGEFLFLDNKGETIGIVHKNDGSFEMEYKTSNKAFKSVTPTKEQIIKGYSKKNDLEINRLKQELANVESGQTQLSSIAKFYEETIANILKKQGYNPIEVTDEHGNTWNEVTLDQNTIDSNEDIDLLIPSANTQLKATEEIRKRKIDKDIVALRRDLANNIENIDTSLAIQKRLHQLVELRNNEFKGVDRRIIEAKDASSYATVLGFADTQLGEIDKMLSGSTLTADNVQYAQRIVDLWIKAGDFTMAANEHLMLDEDEFNTPEIRTAFRLREGYAKDLLGRIKAKQKEYITNFVRKYTDENLSQDEIFKLVKDVSWASANTLNIARHDNNLLQAIFLGVQEANIKAQQEANVVWEDIDKLSKKFLNATGNSYTILKQVTDDGKETGRMTNRFSHEFFDVRNKLSRRAFLQRDKNGRIKKSKKDVDLYYEWVNKNTITFDNRLLFDDSQSDVTIPDKFLFKSEEKVTDARRNAHIQELKKQLGEKGYDFYIKKQEKKLQNFKEKRALEYEKIQSDMSNNSQAERDAFFEEWLREYSPYWGSAMLENPKFRQKADKTYYTAKGIREYSVQVPRRYDSVNNETGWYDKNFEKIESNEDILNYYNFVIETMNNLKYSLPSDQQSILGVGVLPTVEKSIMDMFSEKGMMMGIVPFWDKLKQSLTTTDFATEVTADINPNTGKIYKSIATPFVEDTSAKAIGMVNIKIIAFEQENGREPTSKEISAMRDQAMHELSTNKSWDITRIMKAFALTTLAHKHKSTIQAEVEMSVDQFNALYPNETNKKGETLTDPDGKIVEDKKSGELLKSALDFTMNETLYGIASRKVEGATKNKLYSSKEEVRKKEIEKLLENEEDEENIKFLNDELKNLGSVVTGSGVGDTVLKYMTIKGLGWNTFSAFSNIGFGVISNIIQGSDGREYSMQQLRKAYMLTNNSIGRNASFNTWEGVNGNALKIRTMMDQWDLLQTTNKELFKSTNGAKNPLSRFGPFTMQERSEYLNYAPVMIASMMTYKATSPDGDVVTLWDAMGIDGKLKEGFTANDVNGKPFNEIKMIQKIKRIIEMNHGDYNNALQIKSTFLGRAVSQFRTWMFEGFANRFETEKTDWALSYGMDEPYILKGRYKSYTKGQMVAAGATVGTLFLPGIGTAAGGAIGGLVSKFFGLQTDTSMIQDTMFNIKQLARKALFQKTQYDEKGFSKVDAANMRKNMTELYLMVTLAGIGLVLKSLASGDDEEKKNFAFNFLINQVNRLQTDISFYTNPLEAEKLTKTMLPVFQILIDFKKLGTDIGHFYDDDMENDTFISGPFKGKSKALVHMGEFFPGTSQGIRLYRTGDKVFGE